MNNKIIAQELLKVAKELTATPPKFLQQDSQTNAQIKRRIQGFENKVINLCRDIQQYLSGQINTSNDEYDISEELKGIYQTLNKIESKFYKM